MNGGGERLAFGGADRYVEPSAAAPPVARAADVSASTDEVAAWRKDLIAYRALLAFTFVLFTRPQDFLPFLEPLHLAEVCSGCSASSCSWPDDCRAVSPCCA